MINKEQSIRTYIDAHLKRRWSLIYDPVYRSYWIIELKNRYWILDVHKNGSWWIRGHIVENISDLYDIPTEQIHSIFKNLMEDLLKKKISQPITRWEVRQVGVNNVLERGDILNHG